MPVRNRGKVVVGGVLAALMGVVGTMVDASQAGARSSSCSARKACSTGGDTVSPTVSISAPTPGATVSGPVTVSGSAADNVSVAKVEVQVDSAPFQSATGTMTWSLPLGTESLADGAHIITARATDTSGRTSTSSVTVAVANPGSAAEDIRLADPAATHGLALLGRGKMASSGSLTGLLYWEKFTSRRAMFFRESGSGATSYVSLSVDTSAGWSNATYAVDGAGQLWVWGGEGPVYLRRFQLSGSPVPNSATLVSTETFGDADSRPGDLVVLAGGGLVAVWRQQGQTGPQGLGVAYRSVAGVWQTTFPLQFTPTFASKQVVAQHPADGSVWLFNDTDAYGAIGAAHFTEAASGLRLDWTDADYITESQYGDYAPDPENPDLAVASDPANGTLVLAYQSKVRQIFSTNPVVTGSHVAVVHVATGGPTSFLTLATYVERISTLGLSVRQGETWLAYRPIDQASLTFDTLQASVFRNGAWNEPAVLGRLADPYALVGYSAGGPAFAAEMADGGLHLLLQT